MSKIADILDNEISLTDDDMILVNELIHCDEEIKKEENTTTNVRFGNYIEKFAKYFLLIIIFFTLVFLVRQIPFEEIANKRYRVKTLKDAAYNYTWMEEIDLEVGTGTRVQISELKDRNLIRDKELLANCTGYVDIKNKKYKYRYKVNLKCDN